MGLTCDKCLETASYLATAINRMMIPDGEPTSIALCTQHVDTLPKEKLSLYEFSWIDAKVS